jgi:hypothetical protein
MIPVNTSTCQSRFEHLAGRRLDEVLSGMCMRGEFPRELLPEVIHMVKTKYIRPSTLSSIIGTTGSTELLETALMKNVLSVRQYCELFRKGIATAPVEMILCEELRRCFWNDYEMRRIIVDVLAENGGGECLEALHEVRRETRCAVVENTCRLRLMENHDEDLDSFLPVTVQMDERFIGEVQAAIDRIHERSRTGSPDSFAMQSLR